jgi:sodium borate transporter 11
LTGGIVFYLQKGTKNELETGRTFATLFSDVCFRSQLLQANSEEEFKKILEEQAKDLAERQRLAVMKIPLTEEKPPITVSIIYTFYLQC